MTQKLNKTEARQGEPRLIVRRTLVISLILAILALAVVYFAFFGA